MPFRSAAPSPRRLRTAPAAPSVAIRPTARPHPSPVQHAGQAEGVGESLASRPRLRRQRALSARPPGRDGRPVARNPVPVDHRQYHVTEMGAKSPTTSWTSTAARHHPSAPPTTPRVAVGAAPIRDHGRGREHHDPLADGLRPRARSSAIRGDEGDEGGAVRGPSSASTSPKPRCSAASASRSSNAVRMVVRPLACASAPRPAATTPVVKHVSSTALFGGAGGDGGHVDAATARAAEVRWNRSPGRLGDRAAQPTVYRQRRCSKRLLRTRVARSPTIRSWLRVPRRDQHSTERQQVSARCATSDPSGRVVAGGDLPVMSPKCRATASGARRSPVDDAVRRATALATPNVFWAKQPGRLHQQLPSPRSSRRAGRTQVPRRRKNSDIEAPGVPRPNWTEGVRGLDHRRGHQSSLEELA